MLCRNLGMKLTPATPAKKVFRSRVAHNELANDVVQAVTVTRSLTAGREKAAALSKTA